LRKDINDDGILLPNSKTSIKNIVNRGISKDLIDQIFSKMNWATVSDGF
jgi:hypothetical protein